MKRVLLVALALFAILPSGMARGAIFCPDDRFEMPIQTSLPWSAVGYLNNGCTATLIDSEHIQAAAHCFVDPVTGAWQDGPEGTGLRFYPNYNPAALTRVPDFAQVDRVVVGSRTEGAAFPPPAFPAMDWGVAHLASPITDYEPMPILPVPATPWPVMNAAYQRDPDLFTPGPQPQPPEPATTCGNCWWIPALVDPACAIVKIEKHMVNASCSSLGGSSGSPLIWSKPTTTGVRYYVGGSVFGGAAPLPGVDCEPFSIARATFGPTAASYRFAPRLAQGVAVAAAIGTSPVGRTTRKTLLFASDTDSGRVALRARAGFSLASAFKPFSSFGDVPNPVRMAAFNYPSGPYHVFATTDGGELWGRQQGRKWIQIGLPEGAGGAVDIDSLYNARGTDRLFLVTGDGRAFSRRFGGVVRSPGWSPLPDVGEPCVRIAATDLGRGRARVFLVTASGSVYVTAETGGRSGLTWDTPVLFGGPPDMPAIADLDAAWAKDAPRTRVFAVDVTGGLWRREMQTTATADGWKDWTPLLSSLVAPQAGGQPPPGGIISITAGHWQETTAGGPRPVLFVTDAQGNVYYATESLVAYPDGSVVSTWGWLSFYHY
jgi:hypothetical protein